MKNTKRFLALILALILATSGILSGIPGGGVARAEEAETDVASLSQNMAEWDVGSEIIGEDFAGEPWVEESPSSAVVEADAEKDVSPFSSKVEEETESRDVEKSSDVIEEEAEDEKDETLTDAVFGEYDPASAAESRFNTEEELSDQGFEEKAEYFEEDSEEFEKRTVIGKDMGYVEEEEEQIASRNILAGAGGTGDWVSPTEFDDGLDPNCIYFDPYGLGSPWNTATKIYIFATTSGSWGDRAYEMERRSDGLWYKDLTGWTSANTTFIFLPQHWGDFNGGIAGIGCAHTNESTTTMWDARGKVYHCVSSSNLTLVLGAIRPTPALEAGRFRHIYFDATLSKMVETANLSSQNDPSVSGTRSIPYGDSSGNTNVGDVYVWMIRKSGSTLTQDSGKAMDRVTGTDFWETYIDTKNYDTIIFQSVESGIPHGSARTIALEVPPVDDMCFFCDAGDPYVYSDTYRQGYWGTYANAKRDPGLRAAVTELGDPTTSPSSTGLYSDYHPTDPDDNSIVNVDDTANRKSGRKYVSMTIYDYYSDWELNGQNRDEYPISWTSNWRTMYQFRNFDTALSKYYENASTNNPLYLGHFQPDFQDSDWFEYYHMTDWFPLYGFSHDGSTQEHIFESTNNSAKNVNGSVTNTAVNPNEGYGMYAAQGLVNSALTGVGENKNITIAGTDSSTNPATATSANLPFFDKAWLEGGNDLHTVFGKVYSNVAFPFQKQPVDDVDYWVYNSNDTVLALKTNSADNTKLILDPTETEDNAENVAWSHNKGSGGADTSATLDGETLSYGFFPFNADTEGDTAKYNYGYGVRLDIPFSLPETLTVTNKDGESAHIKFKFSGDDDVWIFIDNKLVLDIGGAHGAVSGEIDFTSGTATVNKVKKSYAYQSITEGAQTIQFSDVGLNFADKNAANYSDPTADHTLTMFYMERGMWESNMKITYNFPDESVFEIEKEVDVDAVHPQLKSLFTNSAIYAFEIRNQATHYGTKDAEPSTVKKVLNTSMANSQLSKHEKSRANIMQHEDAYPASTPNRDDVAHWKAQTDTNGYREYRYGTIMKDSTESEEYIDISGMKYLDFYIYSTDSRVSLSNIYIQILDKDGNARGTPDGSYLNGRVFGAAEPGVNTWSKITVDLEKLPIIDTEKGFDNTSVQGFRFGCTVGVDIYLDEVYFSSTAKYTGKKGFATDQKDIPDYGSATLGEMEPVDGAYYKLSEDAANSYQVGSDGKVVLKGKDKNDTDEAHRKYATFTDQFRLGSYISVTENPDDLSAFKNVFDVSWKLFQYDSAANNYEETPFVTSPPSVTYSPAITDETYTAVHDRVEPYDSGKTSTTTQEDDGKGGTKDVTTTNVYPNPGTRPSSPADVILFRNRWDDTTSKDTVDNISSVRLKALYTNTVNVGTLTIKKEKADTSDPLTGTYNFEVTFTNIGGLALESNPITIPVSIDMNAAEPHIAQITGIPVGTDFSIEEKSKTGGSETTWNVKNVVLKNSNNESSISETVGAGFKVVSGTIGIVGSYENDLTATFTNTSEPLASVNYTKTWQDITGETIKTIDSPMPQSMYVLLQRSTDGGTNWSTITDEIEGFTNPIQITPDYSYENGGGYVWKWPKDDNPIILPARTGTSGNFTWYNYRVVEAAGNTTTRVEPGQEVYTDFKLLNTESHTGTAGTGEGNNIYSSAQTNKHVGAKAKLIKNWAGNIDQTTARFRLDRTKASSFATAEASEITSMGTWTLTRSGTTNYYTLTPDAGTGVTSPAPTISATCSNDGTTWEFIVQGLLVVDGWDAYKYRFVEVDGDNSDANITSGNHWKSYTVTYADTGSGGLPEGSLTGGYFTTTVSNTYETVFAKVQKTWYGEDGSVIDLTTANASTENYPTPVVTLEYSVDNGANWSAYTGYTGHATGEWNLAYRSTASESWNTKVTGLPKYINGTLVQYRFVEKEAGVPTGYVKVGNESYTTTEDENTWTAADFEKPSENMAGYATSVANEPATINLTVKKKWQRWNGTAYVDIAAPTTASNIPDNVYAILQRTTVENPTESDWSSTGIVVQKVGDTGIWSNGVVTIPKAKYGSSGDGVTVKVQQYKTDLSGGTPALYKYRFVEANSEGIVLADNAAVPGSTVSYPAANTVLYKVARSETSPATVYADNAVQTLVNKDTAMSAKVWKVFTPVEDAKPVTVGLYRTTTANAADNNASWTLVGDPFILHGTSPDNVDEKLASSLERQDGTGNLYYYKFFEVNGTSGSYTHVASGNLHKGFTATYTMSHSPSAGNDVEETITNTKDKVNAVLTKVWPSSTASEIYVSLQRAIASGSFPSYDAAIGTATGNLGTYTISIDGSGNLSVTAESGSVSADTPTKDNSNWVLTIPNLDRYDDENNQYQYRFVERKTLNGVYAEQGNQVGAYLVDYGVSTGIGSATLNDGKTAFEQTITNTPAKIKFDIWKIDSATYNSDYTTATGLNGAVFTLNKMDGTTVEKTWKLTTTGTGTNQGKISIADAINSSTSTKDIVDGLGDGEYELYESTAPLGYAMHSGRVTFTVSGGAITDMSNNYTASGIVESSLTATMPKVPLSQTDAGITTYHFVFENTAGTELPGTGTAFGLSRMGFASLGTVLLTAFVVLYQYKKRRQYYGEWKE